MQSNTLKNEKKQEMKKKKESREKAVHRRDPEIN